MNAVSLLLELTFVPPTIPLWPLCGGLLGFTKLGLGGLHLRFRERAFRGERDLAVVKNTGCNCDRQPGMYDEVWTLSQRADCIFCFSQVCKNFESALLGIGSSLSRK